MMIETSVIRLGVDKLSQYPPSLLRAGHLDYRLLRIGSPPSSLEIEVFEDITRRMQLSSGVYRTTSPARLRDLDEWVIGLLGKSFVASAPLAVEDWAASDCSTSAHWHGPLVASFPNAVLTASDLNVYLLEMLGDYRGSFILDAALGPLQYVDPPFVIRLRPAESPWLAVNWLLARKARHHFEQLGQRHGLDPSTVRFSPGTNEIRHSSLVFRRIPLIHPSASTLDRQSASFRVNRHSIFDPADSSADVIRTMNILNVSYFDTATLERGVRNVWRSLNPEGWWIVGRTIQEEPVIHHASILIKTPNGFRLLERYNEKSEVEDLALTLRT